ncbi:MAG: ABC transporter ATP-binding protein [Prevotellaceae bacterium]|jgi:ABC-type multidrug transport system ATPase subunit|nr:ABC transporter ATP-binding protein [Prevotellaceae bacterium]
MKSVIANNLAKRFGAVEALKNVSFDVEQGEIFGIVGPDGAGKTTLFRILTTLILADAGSASIDGRDVVRKYREIRQHIGYMPGKFSIYRDLTVEENLRFFATLFNTAVEKNSHLVKDIYAHIEPFKERRAGALSGGMKQKLALCCALIHKPDTLFLDEPTTGIDPVSRKDLWVMLQRLRNQNISILVSTPYMDEAAMCNRIALVKDGVFMKIDSPAAIIASYSERLWAAKAGNMPRLLKCLRTHCAVKSAFAFGDVHHVTVNKGFSVDELTEYLTEKGNDGVVVYPVEPGIEDCYMQLAES